MSWFRRRAEVSPTRFLATEQEKLRRFLEWKAEREREQRQARIADTARRIAEQLYATYRLAAIITNAPDPAERIDCIDGLLDEAFEAATKIEDGLKVRGERLVSKQVRGE